MHKLIISIIRLEKLDEVIADLKKHQITFTFSRVKAFSKEVHLYRKDIQERIRIEIIAEEKDISMIKDLILTQGGCGLTGHGCITVLDIQDITFFT